MIIDITCTDIAQTQDLFLSVLLVSQYKFICMYYILPHVTLQKLAECLRYYQVTLVIGQSACSTFYFYLL